MNWLDVIIIILLVIAAVSGLKTGLIKSVFSLIGLIVGVVLAGRFYTALAGNLTFISDENIARIAAFIIIFLVVMIIATILGIVVTRLVSAILLGWLNRLLGAVFSLILGAIFIAAILAVWVKFAGPGGPIVDSVMAPFLLDKFPVILALLPSEFGTIKQFFQ